MGHALPFQSSAGNGGEQREDGEGVANVLRGVGREDSTSSLKLSVVVSWELRIMGAWSNDRLKSSARKALRIARAVLLLKGKTYARI